MSEHRSLVDVLSSHAEQRPSELAYRFLAKGEVSGAAALYSFERLAQRAHAIGAWLQQRVGVGQRALLLYPPGLDFIEAFLGCLSAGVIAVPAFPPRSERTLPRLQSIVANAEPALVLSTAGIADSTRSMSSAAGALAMLPWQITSQIGDELAPHWKHPGVDAEAIAFLQYTSGSTSSPKGVVVSHGNLLANQRAIVAAMRHSERDLQHWSSDLFVSWLPLQHDMGLIGPVLHGLYLGRTTTLMSPLHFLQKPTRWLQAISHFRAHTSGAPNFAYELCVTKAEANPALLEGLDLSHWKTAFNGAEPVRWATMERFAKTFAPCGFRPDAFVPCYGMAETTLLVTGRRRHALPSVFRADPAELLRGQAKPSEQGRALVSCGVTEEQVVVVDPERRVACAEGEVGEIWIAGPSVAQGYWQNPRATAESFGIKLRDGALGFLRSGDLGFLQGQELFVTGRLKDLLIVDGSNHYPHDLELTAEQAHTAVRQSGVVAFALETAAGERPAIVAEVKLGKDTDPEQVIAAIRGAISDAHGVAVCSVALVRPQVVPKTSSGKVQRAACKLAFERGEIELIARRDFEQLTAAAPAEPMRARAFLLEEVARRARVSPDAVSVDRPLSELGLGSRELVELTGALGELLSRELSPALFYDCPTIAHVLRRLETGGVEEPREAQPVGASQEPIAIVSMACRFPGDIDTPEALWSALERGQDLVTRFPDGRWDADALYDPDPDAKGKCYTREGALLPAIDRFDAAFFDVPEREASSMDPQQRLLLEVSWEALERAGVLPASLNESVTGVYVGMFDSGYLDGASLEQLDGYFGTGAISSAASGRIAYTLGLQGPAVTVDTACSASLVAVHLAAQALRNGECDLALAGGVTLMVTPRLFVEFSRVRGLSPSGRCKSFADDADGANWGEGCGMLLLKRLSDAERDGDHVLATLRGSAVNQDGRSQGFTAPNGPAQERVIKRALDASRLAPSDIDYVEAHGTGTPLGDPIEAGALARVFGPQRTRAPLWLGSLKSNIAHTQAAAGVGGLIKVVLSLLHEQLPKTLHVEKPTRHVDWKASGLALVTEAQPWPRAERPRRAGVSAFGVSGTNAHVVVEEAPAREVQATQQPTAAGAGLYVLSARNETALRAQAARLQQYLVERPELALPDVALTLATRRTHFGVRAAVVAKERHALLDALASLGAGETADALVQAPQHSATRGKIAFVFPGQGSQWPEMGKLLLQRSSVFAQSVARCDAALAPHLDWSVSALLRGEGQPDALERIEVVQPALFTMMVSLAALWKELGVTPQAVIGHSQGELAAACVAGALSLEDAATVVARRSQILTRVVGLGGSAAVEMPVEALQALLQAEWGDRLAVAAYNGARSAVVSGEQQALQELLSRLERDGVFTRRLRMTVASHSAQMDPLEREVKAQLASVRGHVSALPMYSTVLAQRIWGDELSTDYWYRNLREPVRFAQTLQQLLQDGYRTFLEVSPHPILSLAVESAADAAEVTVHAFGSLRRDEDADLSLKLAAAKLHVAGHVLPLEQLVSPSARPHDALPTYAFDRQRYWAEPERAAAVGGVVASSALPSAPERVGLEHALARLPVAQRRERLQALLRDELAQVLGLQAKQSLPSDQPLRQLGLDSLKAVDLRNRIGARLGRRLSATLLFDHPTLEKLTDHLLKSVLGLDDTNIAASTRAAISCDEPIAIVSMACRLPGGVDSPEALWAALEQGRDLVEDFPAERWDVAALYDPDPEAIGKSYAHQGGFIHGLDQFDAAFFEISPREARAMDPQQRLLLETTWEALERAGIVPSSLNESVTGVFIGTFDSGYHEGIGLEQMDGYCATGAFPSVASGRISYTLGLQGPALTIDTACSSSLVAVDLACRSLRSGQSDLALAGGVSLLLTPHGFVEFSRLRGLSPTGRCHAFSEQADGASWAEGCGIVVLKRLSDAQRDGNRVLALVRGSAVNQDGKSQGLTAPNGPAQERVIRSALEASGLRPHDIDYVEAHGTGTTLGDPIEAGALAAVFSGHTLRLGSLKSNLAHTQAAAGVSGLIKVVLSLQHELLPKSLYADKPSSHVEWEQSDLELLSAAQSWKRGERVRRAGVSAFGISGTNAHLVVEEAPPLPAAEVAGVAAPLGVWPLVVSARDARGLREQANKLARWLQDHPEADLGSVAYTAALHRSHFEERAAVLASDHAQAVSALQALAADQRHPALVRGQQQRGGKVVFVFPGQGSQWAGMGRALLAQSPAFALAVEACDRALLPLTGWSVLALLRGDSAPELPPLDRVDAVQPALFALSIGLVAVLRALGIEPDAVVGHSQGEVTAAVVSGALTLEDGAKVVALRSQAVREKSGQGGMLLIERPVAEVEALLTPYGSRLSIAAVNTASSTVVSGELAAIDALAARLEKEALFSRRVNVDYASHSAQMDSLLPALGAALSDIAPRAGTIPLYSTVRGEPLSGEQLDATYFCRNLREPVRLDRALDQLLADGHGVFLEVSAHPVLTLSLAELRDRASAIVVGSLQRERGDFMQLLVSLAELHVQGYALPWRALLPDAVHQLQPLPTYAFQRQRYWLETRNSRTGSALANTSEHPLLGAAVAAASGDRWLFASSLGRGSHKWLLDHALFDEVLLSGTTLLELCRAAVATIEPETPHAIAQLALQAPVLLPERGQLQLQVEVVRAAVGFEVALYTREDAAWTLHATALAEPDADLAVPVAPRWPAVSDEHWNPETYARLERLGLHYGAAFRGMRSAVRLGPDAVLARVSLPEALRDDAARYGLHPALLDAAQQSALALSELGDAVMAASVERWSLAHRGAHSLLVLTEQTARSEQGARLQLTLWDEHGAYVGRLSGLDVRRVSPASLRRSSKLERDVHEVIWQPVARVAAEPPRGTWALIGEATEPLSLQLRAAGLGVELVQLAPTDPVPEGVDKVLRVWPAQTEGSLPDFAETLCVQALGELQAAVASDNAPREWVWLTHGAVASAPEEGVPSLGQSGLWGLARSARAEYPNLGLRQIDLGDVAPDFELLLCALSTPDEPELAIRRQQLRAPRLLRADLTQRFELPEGSFALSSQRRGSLDALELSELTRAPLERGQVRIDVHSAGMNFRDVIYALDVQASELASKAVLHTALGSECAGVVVEVGEAVTGLQVGQRVLAIAQGSLASEVVADARLVVEIPAQLSFEEAATIPVAFTTAYYGLRELAAIQPGEKLLVHAAAGGVGMAALQLARAWGVEVYATASPAKWRVLSELGLAPDRIASSRDLSFANEFGVGAGIDVVLNSLAHEYVDASLGLLRPGGRFLELGKTDVRSQESVPVSYWAYDLLEVGPSRVGEMLREVVALVARGALTPLRRQPFPLQDARAAFRLMAHGGHVGKIVLNVPRAQHSVPQSGTILITGGLSGLGLASARRLAERGAKHFLLLSRKGAADPNAAAAIESLSVLGAEVQVAACDISDRAALAAQLAKIPLHAPLKGIVHSAAVLDDGLLIDQTPERVARVMSPKVRGGYYLHELTKDLPLELFVMYSSAAGVAGSPGQTNYAAANVFLDQLCHERRARGLPASSLAWGGWSEVGLAVKHVDLARNDARGYVTMTPAHGLALLELALTRSTAPHQVLWTLQPALLQKTFGVDVPAMWRGIVQPKPVDTKQQGELSQSLARLPAAARHERVVELLCDDAASVLGLRAAGDVPSNQPLKQLGLDSLMALELRNRIGARFQCRLSPSLLFDHPTLDALGRYLLEHVLKLDAAAAPSAVAATSGDTAEPIAIISMACRYPAGVDTPAALWSVLADGRDLVEDIPVDRWDISALFDADPDAPGKTYARQGGFVRDVDKFDAAFFEIAPREARAMDPQQRLLLETAWEALERAGVVPASLNESLTGVYVGMFESGYFEGTSLDQMDGYSATGSTCSVASGRLAYTLGLQGPAITVDTACSSSLVAIHLASQALRAGECDMALAGGITLMLTPRGFVEFSRVRLVSPAGRCKSFSDDADGAGWSDGCGMLLLKRLSDAQRDGDRVLGVIRATAVNQDGRSQGLTAPNGPAQERVMRRALALAQLSAADVDYVEAHGTGTALGDPIEANALAQVYGRERPAGQPLFIGSLKSNLAHSQAASGVGGLMKVVLSLLHEQLPATLHAGVPTRHVDWEHSGVALVNEPRAWTRAERPRRAGVSAFGISGTNAHVIVEEAPQLTAAAPATTEAIFKDAPLLIPVSARSQAALYKHAARLADHVESRSDLLDFGHTLALRRSHFERRAAIVTRQTGELTAQLRALATGEAASGVAHVPDRARTRGKLAFVFPGHGPQWLAMGKALSERCPVFARELERCDAALAPHTGFSVLAVLRGEPGAPELERVDVVQPALFAMTVALSALWRALGVEPDAVVGHSFGEIAAAHVAGALSLEDAAQVVALRARALAPLCDLGGMAVVELPAAELSKRLGAGLQIGAYNSPSTCAVSGEASAIEALLTELEQEQIFARRVRIRFASHSPHVESARAAILEQLATVHGHASQLPLYSTVDGKLIDGDTLDAGYFYRNLREPVLFAPAIERMQADGYRYFVELSPHPMLLGAIDELAQRAGLPAVTVGSLRREQDPVENMCTALAQLYAGGRELAWEKLLPAGGALDSDVPTYAFDRQSYKREPSLTPRTRSQHGPLVQQHIESSERPGQHMFETDLDLNDPGYRYLEGHRIVGAVWLPGSALLEMALEAGRVVYPQQGVALEDVSFERAVELAEEGVTRLQLLVQPVSEGRRSFRVVSRAHGSTEWTHHAQGYMRPGAPSQHAPITLAQLQETCGEQMDGATFYSLLAAAGFERGATFQGIAQAWRGELQALVKLTPLSAAEHLVHPALLDAALQGITLPTRFPSERAFVPAGVASLQLYAAERPAWAVCKIRELAPDSVTADITLLDAQERVVLEVRGFREVAEARLPKLVHAVQWRALPALAETPQAATTAQPWLVLADQGGVAESLVESGIYLRPSATADFVRVLRGTFGTQPPRAIVHAWSLDAPAIEDAETLAEAERLCVTSTLRLVQAIEALAWSPRPRLFILTRGAQRDVVHPEQALAWGFGASLAQEHPELSPTLIDLDDGEPSEQRVALQQLLLQPSENRIVLRGAERWVPRLVRQALPQARVSIRADRSYLVTGGLGGLGLVIAERLIAQGARHLVLLSRRGERQEDRAKLTQLRSTGAQVHALAADVTDRASLARALSSVAPAVAGVIHAAGVIEDGTVLNLSPERVGVVLAPKTLGTALLAELLPELELFVLFSSISAVLGSAGQTVYAAANAYLDAWAQQRTAAGKPALSLSWGPWSEVGMASDPTLRQKNLGASLIDPITPEEGAALFELSLSSPRAQLVLAGLDRERLAPIAGELPLLHELCGQPREQVGSTTIVQQLSQTRDVAARRALLEAHLAILVARVADSNVTPSPDSALKELGLDSLMLLNLRNLISRELHVELSTGKLLSLPTIAELAEHLQGALASGEVSAPTTERVHGPVTEAERWPATRDVMRLLRSEQQGTPNAAHNIGTAARLHTRHSHSRIEQVLEGIVLRHAALRTAIVPDAEHGHAMLVAPTVSGPMLRRSQLRLRLDALPDAGVALINERLCALLEPAFVWSEAPLWRFELLEDNAGAQVLLLGAHHAVSDARSIMMVLGELDAELGGRALDRTASNRDMVTLLRAQPLSAADVASDDAPVDWRKEFSGAKRLELTLASQRPSEPSYRLGGVSLPAPAGLFERVGVEASRLGVTPAAYFMGVLTALIARVAGQSRFAVGVPVDTRGHADAEDALGFFGVPVPLPAAAHLDDAISDIIRRTDQQFASVLQRGAAFANALPALVAEGLYQKGAPLIELFFNYINPRLSEFERLSLLDVGAGYGDVDLMVVVAPALQQVRLEFQVDILDADSCRLLGEAYLALLDQPFKTVAQVELSPALERVARAAKPLALPLAATFALGELPEFLAATFREAGLPVAVAEAPYHQVLASLLDPSGVFAQPGGLAGIVLLRGIDLMRYRDDWSDKSLRELADEYVAALSRLSQRADAAPLLVGFLPDASDDARFRSWERQLAEQLSQLSGVVVLRSQDWSEHYPVEERFAVEADVLGHLPFSAQFLAALALTITRKVWGMRQRPLKVVAVDGDNTLWGGIAGEIGPEAVDLSGPRAVLARKLLELRAAGVLLALVSNNDEATVRRVLARADSTLHAEHFSVISAEWDDKHVRLARAAETLSLGLDSFVFLDDNPVEIAAVRARSPQVMAITVPAGDELESFVSNLWALDVRAVTLEDHKRAGFYQDEQLRTSMRNEADDFTTFVERLDLKLELAPLTAATLERSVQLTRRTNQFNLRPSHPAARALRTLSAQPGTEVWTLSVRDRFGDYGQVGVIALEQRGTTLEVLGFMLSCRVLGRGVEQRIVHWLAERAEALSCSEVKLVAEHTERNIPARRLVAALGGGHVESQRLEVTLSPERLRAYRAHAPSSETTQRTGEVDVHGY